MSTWNHRVFRTSEGGYVIKETHYDDGGVVKAWTENSIAPYGEDLETLRWELERMLAALDKPVLEDTNRDGTP